MGAKDNISGQPVVITDPIVVKKLPTTQPILKPAVYLAMSLRRLALLTFFTGGLYSFYWFYKNWQAIKQAEMLDIAPLWRALFSIFYVVQLFKHIYASANSQGFTKRQPAVGLAVAYIIISLVVAGLSSIPTYNLPVSIAIVVGSALSILPLVLVQKAINYSNTKVLDAKPAEHKTTKWEKVLIAVGLILFVVMMAILFIPDLTAVDNNALTQEIVEKDAVVTALTEQYDTCSAELATKEPLVDAESQAAIDTYNSEVSACERVRLNQNQAADDYNALIGQ